MLCSGQRGIQWGAFSKAESVFYLMWYVVGDGLGVFLFCLFWIVALLLPYRHMRYRKRRVFLAVLHFEWGLQVSERGH